MNDWAMVGIGDSTPEIETGVLAGGTAAALSAAFTGGFVGTQDGAVTVTDTSGTIAATVLSGIGAETDGTVTAAASGITISGTSAQLTAA